VRAGSSRRDRRGRRAGAPCYRRQGDALALAEVFACPHEVPTRVGKRYAHDRTSGVPVTTSGAAPGSTTSRCTTTEGLIATRTASPARSTKRMPRAWLDSRRTRRRVTAESVALIPRCVECRGGLAARRRLALVRLPDRGRATGARLLLPRLRRARVRRRLARRHRCSGGLAGNGSESLVKGRGCCSWGPLGFAQWGPVSCGLAASPGLRRAT
jgi:hypothetical protein